MAKAVPVVYFLFGDDEFGINQFVKEIINKLGDADIASMNVSRLNGKNSGLEEIVSLVMAMPFLSRRRIVIVDNFLDNLITKGPKGAGERIKTQEAQNKFLDVLENIPDTTGFCLVELVEDKDKRSKLDWFFKWAEQDLQRVFIKEFFLPKGDNMVGWIQGKAKSLGCDMTSSAAAALANLVGNDTRLAAQEIEKLQAFTNYQRRVEADDVEMITSEYAQADIFEMVDAISQRQSHRAMSVLQKLLDQQDAMMIFAMIQRQFRLLILAREVMDQGGSQADIARRLKVHPFVSNKLYSQACGFGLMQLEEVYRRLLGLDEEVKTGQIEIDLALDTFVAAFTSG